MKAKRSVLFPLLVVLAGTLAYANSFRGVFVFDDSATIEKNLRMRHVLPQGKTEWLFPRALTDLTFAINYATGKLNPADYRATNLLIHLITGLLVYGVVRRTFASERIADRLRKNSEAIAFVSSAIWTVHPLTTAAVTYVSQRYESMMGMFYLLTLYCVIRGNGSSRSALWHGGAIVSCALGMECKEVIITAPAIILIYDWIFLSASFKEMMRKRGLLYVGLLIAILAFAAVPVISEGKERDGVGISYYGRGPSLYYLLTQCNVILQYLKVAIWPYPLCFDYGWLMISRVSEGIPAFIVVCALGLTVVAGLRYRPAAAFLGVWFFVILAPTSSIIPRIDCAFDHRMYLPLLAIIVGAVVGAHEGINRLCQRGIMSVATKNVVGSGLAALAIAILAVMTHFRNMTYFSEEQLWMDVVAVSPSNIRAYVNLTGLWFKQESPQQYERIIAYCRDALAHMPDYSKTDRGEISRRRNDPTVENFYRQIVNYSRVHNNFGLALRALGKSQEAINHLEEASRLIPDEPSPQINIASMQFSLGKTNDAIQRLKRVLVLEPDHVAAHECLARALFQTGETAGAIEQYSSVLRIDPDNLETRCALAWILATSPVDSCRDGKRAVALAETAAAMVEYRSAHVMDILAAACAEAGDFNRAVETQKKAIDISYAAERSVLEQRLDMYSKRLPYRESAAIHGQPLKPADRNGS